MFLVLLIEEAQGVLMIFQEKVLSGIVDYIEDNIMGDLPVDKLSNISGYSRWHLQRMFKKHFGIKLGTYIRYRRLSQSSISLKQTRSKILDIAIAYGFNSQQCYTRAFKNFLGKTPNEFRRSKVWDFSKQVCPYNTSYKYYYYYFLSTTCCHVNVFKKYTKVVYKKINDNRNGKRSFSNCKKMVRHKKDSAAIISDNFVTSCCDVGDGKLAGLLCGYYFSPKRFLVIPFYGATTEYSEFHKKIYDELLPYINAKVEFDFIIEFHKDSDLENGFLCVDIAIPIV